MHIQCNTLVCCIFRALAHIIQGVTFSSGSPPLYWWLTVTSQYLYNWCVVCIITPTYCTVEPLCLQLGWIHIHCITQFSPIAQYRLPSGGVYALIYKLDYSDLYMFLNFCVFSFDPNKIDYTFFPYSCSLHFVYVTLVLFSFFVQTEHWSTRSRQYRRAMY